MLQGVDLSNNNGSVDFVALAGAGIQFVLLKASGGTGFRDPFFPENVRAARAAGLLIGGYHFAFDDNAGDADPTQEAQNFLTAIAAQLQAGDVVALDVERGGGDPELAWVRIWLQTVYAALGAKPWLYASLGGLAQYGLQDASLADYGLWLASWRQSPPPAPPPWPFWAAWQYSSTGSVPGVAGNCDMDEFNGTAAQFAAYGLPQPADPCADCEHTLADVTVKLDAALQAVTAITAERDAAQGILVAVQTDRDRLMSVLGQIAIEAQGATREGA